MVLGNGSLLREQPHSSEALWVAHYDEPYSMEESLKAARSSTTEDVSSYKQKSSYDLIAAAGRQRLFYPNKVRHIIY